MGIVTIVSNELSEEKVQSLQKKADELASEHNYSAHQIMHHFGLKEGLSVSLYSEGRQITMNCH